MSTSSNIAQFAKYSVFINVLYALLSNYSFTLFNESKVYHNFANEVTMFKSVECEIKNCYDYEPIDRRWNKVGALLNYMKDSIISNDPEYLVWMDTDLIVTNFTFYFEEYVSQYPNAELIISGEFHVESGVANTGCFIIRKSEWSLKFLQYWWSKFDHSLGHDQTFFSVLYKRLSEHQGQCSLALSDPDLCDLNDDRPLTAKIIILPPDKLNSLPLSTGIHQNYGNFLHLMGEDDRIRGIVMRLAAEEIIHSLRRKNISQVYENELNLLLIEPNFDAFSKSINKSDDIIGRLPQRLLANVTLNSVRKNFIIETLYLDMGVSPDVYKKGLTCLPNNYSVILSENEENAGSGTVKSVQFIHKIIEWREFVLQLLQIDESKRVPACLFNILHDAALELLISEFHIILSDDEDEIKQIILRYVHDKMENGAVLHNLLGVVELVHTVTILANDKLVSDDNAKRQLLSYINTLLKYEELLIVAVYHADYKVLKMQYSDMIRTASAGEVRELTVAMELREQSMKKQLSLVWTMQASHSYSVGIYLLDFMSNGKLDSSLYFLAIETLLYSAERGVSLQGKVEPPLTMEYLLHNRSQSSFSAIRRRIEAIRIAFDRTSPDRFPGGLFSAADTILDAVTALNMKIIIDISDNEIYNEVALLISLLFDIHKRVLRYENHWNDQCLPYLRTLVQLLGMYRSNHLRFSQLCDACLECEVRYLINAYTENELINVSKSMENCMGCVRQTCQMNYVDRMNVPHRLQQEYMVKYGLNLIRHLKEARINI